MDVTRERLHALASTLTHKDKGATLVVTFANFAFKELLLNWVANVKKTGVEGFLIGAMDAELLKLCHDKRLPAYSLDDPGLLEQIPRNEEVTPMKDLGKADFRSDHKAFRNMGARKGGFVLALLQLGYSVLISDADAVFIKDPVPFFSKGPLPEVADVWVSTDCLSIEADRGRARLPVEHQMRPPFRWWRKTKSKYDFEQNGNIAEASFNTGMLFFWPRNRSIAFVQQWIATMIHSGKNLHNIHIWDDQQAFNMLARMGPGTPGMMDPLIPVRGGEDRVFWCMNKEVRLGIMPLHLFQNGHTYFVQRVETDHALMVHNTFQYNGVEGKIARFRQAGLWLTDEDSYFMGKKYLTYDSSLPQFLVQQLRDLHVTFDNWAKGPWVSSHMRLVAHHLLSLRNAMALAEALGRTLIVPKLTCHCDRYWFPIINSCRSPGADLKRPFVCTMDMLFNLNAWNHWNVKWREDIFLESDRLPNDVKTSKIRVKVAAQDDGQARDQVFPAYATDKQAVAALERYKDVAVIELSSAHDAFCAFEEKAANRRFDDKIKNIFVDNWCCHKNGSLVYDRPAGLLENQIIAEEKTCKPAVQKHPMVQRAKVLEVECRNDKKCMSWNIAMQPPDGHPYRKFDNDTTPI